MAWNYRVLAFKEDDSIMFKIKEVHYDSKGNPSAWGDKICEVQGESESYMEDTLHRMGAAISKPVLDADNWPNEYQGKPKFRDIYNGPDYWVRL